MRRALTFRCPSTTSSLRPPRYSPQRYESSRPGPMASPSPLLPTLARRLSFGSSQASSSLLPATSSSSSRRSISSSAPLCERRPDEWTYPSIEGDNKPRRPFLNPDISEKIPNEVAIRAGYVPSLSESSPPPSPSSSHNLPLFPFRLKPYRLPSQSLDVYEVVSRPCPALSLSFLRLSSSLTSSLLPPSSKLTFSSSCPLHLSSASQTQPQV